MPPISKGQRVSWSRAITEDDVRRFSELSGDKGIHHQQKDEQGRLMAHGLLTATLPTKVGGDFNYIAKTMHFDFVKAVYAGDTLTCEGVVESVIEQSARFKVKFSFTVKNQHDDVVLTGDSAGQILRR